MTMTERPKLNLVARLSDKYASSPLVRALLQLVPGWGAADIMIEHRASEIHKERLQAFFDAVADGILQLTEELINSEDFLHCYFKTLKAASNTRRREKIQMFGHLLTSAICTTNIDTDLYEELLDTLDSITYREFAILFLLYSFELDNPWSGEREASWVVGHWEQFFTEACRQFLMSEAMLNAYLKRLQRSGLYVDIPGKAIDFYGSPGYTTPLFKLLLKYIGEEIKA